MKHEKREISIPAGTLVESSEREALVRLKAGVYVEAIRESSGSWLYAVGDEIFRVSGGLISWSVRPDRRKDDYRAAALSHMNVVKVPDDGDVELRIVDGNDVGAWVACEYQNYTDWGRLTREKRYPRVEIYVTREEADAGRVL